MYIKHDFERISGEVNSCIANAVNCRRNRNGSLDLWRNRQALSRKVRQREVVQLLDLIRLHRWEKRRLKRADFKLAH